MIKRFTLMLVFLLVICVGLFWNMIIDLFRTMTPLEAMQRITTFVLHVIVASIFGYVAYTVNELVQSWIRTFHHKQRIARKSARRPRQPAPAKPSSSRSSRLALNDVIKIVGALKGPGNIRRDHRAPKRKPAKRIRLDF